MAPGASNRQRAAGVIPPKGLVFGPHPAGESGGTKRQEKSGHKKIRGSVGAVSAFEGVTSTCTQFSLLEWGCQLLAHSGRLGLYSLHPITP